MLCNSCGKTIPDDAAVCPECGAPVAQPEEAAAEPVVETAEPVVETAESAPAEAAVPVEPAVPSAQGLTLRQFLKLPENKKIRNNINLCSILIYVFAAITCVTALTVPDMGAGIIDAILLAGLGLWLHLAKTRVPAVIVLLYSIFNVIVMLVTTGQPGGWLVALIGVDAVINTFKARKAYNAALGK